MSKLLNFVEDINQSVIVKKMVAYKSSNNKSIDPIGPSCKKAIYSSREEALDMISYINENRIVKELHAYECPTCGMWHLSSKSK